MSFKLIGAVLVLCGCGFVGFSTCAAYRREEHQLRQMLSAMDHMVCELQYRVTPLPELCRQASAQREGFVKLLFSNLASELDAQVSPDVQSCLAVAAAQSGSLSPRLEEAICILGASLGCFDLQGQLQGLESVRSYCSTELKQMADGREHRLRSYQTLGLCAGAALAILLV